MRLRAPWADPLCLSCSDLCHTCIRCSWLNGSHMPRLLRPIAACQQNGLPGHRSHQGWSAGVQCLCVLQYVHGHKNVQVRLRHPCHTCPQSWILKVGPLCIRYWTYATKGRQEGTCWLKSSITANETQPHRTSGKVCKKVAVPTQQPTGALLTRGATYKPKASPSNVPFARVSIRTEAYQVDTRGSAMNAQCCRRSLQDGVHHSHTNSGRVVLCESR